MGETTWRDSQITALTRDAACHLGSNEGTVHLRAERTTFISGSSARNGGVCLHTCASKETRSPWSLARALTHGDLLLKDFWAQHPHL